ncbi:aminoglycoside phosphotransferase family protein [Exiguobacterium acetylicum]|uniref:aminoglycoside phosphotransferase family protein n=1 Tax=Exiguobacterium acetylicum TaxID=41170 RepID=UPI001EE2A753|nr:aminoglycoside phosphotransferase family protein [Exiguobacterium acetylicum]UKS57566.1 aminoglycoside phosphotransferase family protein [Exiguobacterium acetylicum]
MLPNHPLLQKIQTVKRLPGRSDQAVWSVKTLTDHFIVKTVIDPASLRYEQEATLLIPEQQGIAHALPLATGRTATIAYGIYPYLSGRTVRSVLRETPELATELGQETGKALKRIHAVPAPSEMMSWSIRCQAKHDRYRAAIEDLLASEWVERLDRFIGERLALLQTRPNRLQHDDVHLDNLLVEDGHLSAFLDYGNHDYGDPWHDFVKCGLFQVETSPVFASHMINGYFKNEVPSAFWQVYSLYAAMVVFSSLVWTKRFDASQVPVMQRRVQRIIQDHDGFRRDMPLWYEA